MEYRKILENLSPYKPGKNLEEIKKEYGLDEIVKLASNENPYGTSPKVLKSLSEIDILETYPDNYCTKLRKKLSKKYDIPEDYFIFGNGSVEIIQMISRILLDSSSEAITCVPSFSSYWSEAILQNSQIIEVPLKNYKFDLNGILEKINDRTKLIYITNPNNPTGTIVTDIELNNFLAKVPNNILVVLDEAYFEFVKNSEYPNSIRLLKKFSNICILRTFSKAYGLAGLRIGYGITSPETILELEKARVPFNASFISQIAAQTAIDDTDFVDNCIKRNKEVLEYLYNELDVLGLFYIKSEANFIMIDVKMPSEIAFEKLLKQGFIVRPSFPKMDTFIRVSIGTMDQIEKFINALKNIY